MNNEIKKEVLVRILLEKGFATSGINLDRIEYRQLVSSTPYPAHWINIFIDEEFVDRIDLNTYMVFDRDYKIDDLLD
jgi:hypothetical protein